jgi:hypothetical protein
MCKSFPAAEAEMKYEIYIILHNNSHFMVWKKEHYFS